MGKKYFKKSGDLNKIHLYDKIVNLFQNFDCGRHKVFYAKITILQKK